MKKILVTGSDGYIGSVLINDLIGRGYDVVGLDTLFFEGCTLGKYKIKYNLIKGDTRFVKDINLEQFEAIIHLAALSNDPIGNINQSLTEDINYHATVNLAKLAKKNGVRRFIFSSSCSIYGIGQESVVSEDTQVNPLTAYAKSKINSENALSQLADKNFCIGILRNSTVYGYSPKFRDDLVVNNLVTNGLTNKIIKVMSDGTPWRPLIDVRDLSSIFCEFLAADAKLINGQVFNIGFNENNFQVKDLLSEIRIHLPDCEIIYTGEHGSDTRSYRVNFDKFHRVFPHIIQEWYLRLSVIDLIKQLKQKGYSLGDMEYGKFSRISVLKKLMMDKRIDRDLYWIS